MRAIIRDIRYGFRSLIKSPGLAIVATIALTFGIGLTTTMFSIVYGALMKGLPFPEGNRIVAVFANNPSRGVNRNRVSYPDYAEFRQQQRSLQSMGAYTNGTVNVSGTGEPERFAGAWVTSSLFEVTRVAPLLGRVIRAGEDVPNGARVVVISYSMWQTRFAGDPAVIGKSIRANATPYEIVGVMPEGYLFPDNASIWLPLQADPLAPRRDAQSVEVVARLKNGETLQSVSTDLNVVARRLQEQYKETNEGVGALVMGYVDSELGDEPKQLLYTMLGAVFFVLLIACANVANLLLDRAAHRTKEVGVRTALGATRGAVVRQFLTEALVLALGGAVLGTILAGVGIQIFNRAIVDSQPPFFIDIALHPPVLLFVSGVAVLATLFSGIIPAYQSSRADINEVLKDESRGSSSLRIGKMSRALVVFEIALSCGLLVASGLMIKSVVKLKNIETGFRTQNILTARIGFPFGSADTVVQKLFFEQLRERLATLPGVSAATLVSALPGTGSNSGRFTIEGKAYAADGDLPNSRFTAVSPGFFETFDMRSLQGRLLEPGDRDGSMPVVVVNRLFAERFFPGENPLGKRIRMGGRDSQRPWMTIVGVVPPTFTGDPEEPHTPFHFVPLAQNHQSFVSIAVQTNGPPMAILPEVRRTVNSLNPDIPLYFIYTMDAAIARPTWYIRVFGTMFMIFGIIALFLASVGLYAVMSFSVSRRVREVGIRMALGARGADVIRMVFRQGIWQLGIGMVLGLALAAGVAQLTQVILFDVQPRDPTIFGGVAAVLAASGLLACLVPARRATRVDPLVALRAE